MITHNYKVPSISLYINLQFLIALAEIIIKYPTIGAKAFRKNKFTLSKIVFLNRMICSMKEIKLNKILELIKMKYLKFRNKILWINNKYLLKIILI